MQATLRGNELRPSLFFDLALILALRSTIRACVMNVSYIKKFMETMCALFSYLLFIIISVLFYIAYFCFSTTVSSLCLAFHQLWLRFKLHLAIADEGN